MIPVVSANHPDYYRFDNPSSVAAADNYQMPHWTKRRIEIHLRRPAWMNIHQAINFRATFQYAEKVSKEHIFRRAWNAEVEHGKKCPPPKEHEYLLRMERMGSAVAWSSWKAQTKR